MNVPMLIKRRVQKLFIREIYQTEVPVVLSATETRSVYRVRQSLPTSSKQTARR